MCSGCSGDYTLDDYLDDTAEFESEEEWPYDDFGFEEFLGQPPGPPGPRPL